MKKEDIFIEHICADCLQEIVNSEQREDNDMSKQMTKTLKSWALQGYIPSGLTDDTDPAFSWSRCPLCGSLPGDRYEYYFRSVTIKKKKK